MENIFNLQDKTILITGASSGIGRQICITASQEGAKILLTGRNELELEATRAQMQNTDNHIVLPFDLSSTGNIAAFVKQLPKLDGIVHCAGIARYVPFKIISEKEIRLTQTLNYEAPLLLTQQILKNKLLQHKGSIVFIASISALIGTVANALYAGSKGALVSATRALSIEIAGQKMRANCISPGMIVTPLTDKIQASVSEEVFKEKEKLHPLGFGLPEDVANATIFMLSDSSRWITGTNLIVDGGYTCH